ncbi:peptidase domain-containing ABC transporter [Sediminicurvatus halobius]|uniref:Type I secretion system permease/ATPase n=1 Tax=Sediminicurvatus halobius TaxID=2182432 RepID=A0A2U2N2I9_9GAMM|nr:type I secretion system permease/ATPase [Spiribacter halobius]PWG63406.1 type I secretion system permease/ATPase [Spiribacter halobius]UEX78076.1 type I secretion system permease/ATPase [Spiribacter halobius]
MDVTDNPEVADPGLTALLVLLGLLQRPTTAETIRRRTGIISGFGPDELLDAAQEQGLAVERVHLNARELTRVGLPALVLPGDGRVLVWNADAPEPWLMDPAAPEERVAPERLATRRMPVLLVRSDSEARARERRRFGLSTLLAELGRYRGMLGHVLAASLMLQLFALATPLFTMVIIDKVLTTGALSTLDVLILGLAAVALFDLAIGLLRSILLADVANRVDVLLSARFFRHLLDLPLAYFARQRTGDVVARVRELESVRQFLTGSGLTALVDFCFALLFLGVMALFSVPLTMVVAAAMAGLLLLYGLCAPVLRRRLESRIVEQTETQSFLTEAVAGVETVKGLGLEPQRAREWESQTVAQSNAARDADQLASGLNQVAQFISKGTIALTLWLGARAVIDGGLTAGGLIAFNMMVGRVMAPAMRLAQLFQQLGQTRVAVRRLADILDRPTEPHPASATELPPPRGAVRFEDVSFRYGPDAPEVIRSVSLEAKPGEVIGIVGQSGAGKTSLLRLIQRLYVPTAGRILLDGVNTARMDPRWLRRHVAAVTQDGVLFNASVRANIAAAHPALPMEKVEQAAELAAADRFVRALPQAYDTVVGERGVELSAGQRQRVALARALAADPRILLLDEPTSALDAIAEQRIQSNLRAIVGGRTVFLVAHRLSTLRICDRVLVLEDGQLVESGPPSALIRAGGPFARLRAAQLGEPQARPSSGEVRHALAP